MIIDYSINNGFTVAWASDVSEKGFVTSNKGIAVMPATPSTDMTDAEITRWETLSTKEKEKELYKLEKPVAELKREAVSLGFKKYSNSGYTSKIIQ